MSGGISAIRGFDYQATVILDLLLCHFGQFGAAAEVRPEGVDDLDMFNRVGDSIHTVHIQIKKPKDDKTGARAPSPWTLGDAIDELFPKTIQNLDGNDHQQNWILGDEVTSELLSLIDHGAARLDEHVAYFKLVHSLARKQVLHLRSFDAATKRQLEQWRPTMGSSGSNSDGLKTAFKEYVRYAAERGVPSAETDLYEKVAADLFSKLPGILTRIKIVSVNGTEDQVGDRVCETLKQRYGLQATVVRDTLFSNLRSFISDISKEPNKRFGLDEFELKIVNVWPTMIAVKTPPLLESEHIGRIDIADSLANSSHRVVEVVGASGSGKSSLATEAIALLKLKGPDHLAYYLEIRTGTIFRDALAGVAFHLRRSGVESGLGVATQGTVADEQAIASFAKLLPALEQPVSLFFDLVDGACNASFARELAEFVRLLTPGNLRLIVLGQERALRGMSAFERESLGIGHVDVRGFHFDEFVELVHLRKLTVDRATLYEIFERVTSGRSAGLIARLAMSLAQTGSVDTMKSIASLDPDKMLVAADRERFMRLSSGVHRAATKLLCFALPFQQTEAAKIFTQDNVGAAIREMLDLGLLRPHDGDMFEMHETIRAGLEQDIALADRIGAHTELATWYRTQGSLPAEILHLGKAGRESDAHQRAREAFLSGHHWGALLSYVTDHSLVTADEAADMLLKSAPGAHVYMLPDLFASCGDSVVGEKLLNQLALHADRFESDYSWASAVVQAVLYCDSSKLHSLLDFALILARKSDRDSGMLGCVQHGALRAGIRWDSSALSFFRKQDETDKRRLLPLLLQDGQRGSLDEAFRFIASQGELLTARNQHSWSINHSLRLDSLSTVTEFLAALPTREVSDMLAYKSVLLEPFAVFVWSQKRTLLRYAIELIETEVAETTVLYNAARVLACLAEPRILIVCDPLRARDEKLRSFFQFLPTLVPWLIDFNLYRNRLLDTTLDLSDRAAMLIVLAGSRADLASLLTELRLCDQEAIEGWEYLFLMQCVQHPFEEALPLLINHMKAKPDSLMAPALIVSFGNLQSERVTDILIGLLSHEEPRVRLAVAQALGQRRSARALGALIAQAEVETDRMVAQSIVVAIVASHPNDSVAVVVASGRFPDAKIWRFVLAARLRDESADSEIIAVSSNKAESWKLRRAAILAAGKLPFACALEMISPSVLAERSPFTSDQSGTLRGHEALVTFLERGISFLFNPFIQNKDEFIEFVGTAFDDFCKNHMFSEGVPVGLDAATWLFERLVIHGFPENLHAPDVVLGELRVPILQAAVLRSLRLCGRLDLIIASIPDSYSLWFITLCVRELMHARITDPVIRAQVVDGAKSSRFYSAEYLQRIVSEYFGPLTLAEVVRPESLAEKETSFVSKVVLTGSDIFSALADTGVLIDLEVPAVVQAETADEFTRLIAQLDPANDYVRAGAEATSLRFTVSGYSVGSGRVQQVSNRADLRAALRPAIAAANRWGLDISWHGQLLSQDAHGTYTKRFLKSLVAQEDSNRFFEELSQCEDILMPHICESRETASMIRVYTDARMAQAMSRYVASGADAFLEGLCTVAAGVNAPDIDTVLDALFTRWIRRFDFKKKWEIQHSQNYELWRAFDRLAEHPRFHLIPQWDKRLQAVMQAELYDFHRSQIMRVLERSPVSYGFVESTLFKTSSFELARRDELDLLDEAADRLFVQSLG